VSTTGANGGPGGRLNFNTLLGLVQLLVVVLGGVVAFMELKGDVRVLAERIANVSEEVDRIRSGLGLPDVAAR
jgi:hypothetical protein